MPLQAESLRIAREHNLLMPLLFGIWITGLALTGKGDYDEALARFKEGLVLSEKVGTEIGATASSTASGGSTANSAT